MYLHFFGTILIIVKQKYLKVVMEEEESPASHRGLFLLQNYCRDGSKPLPGGKDHALFVKELLKYRILDIAALVYSKRARPQPQPRKTLAASTVQKFVCSLYRSFSSFMLISVVPYNNRLAILALPRNEFVEVFHP